MASGLHAFFRLQKQYPYKSLTGFFRLWQHVFLFFFPKRAFPAMNIIPLVIKKYGLSSKAEFQKRYEESAQDFEKMWKAKPRDTKEAIEEFYREHDKDIWRQAYLSDAHYNYKRKILRATHTVLASVRSKNDPVLDYGCGAGVLVHYLARKGCTQVDAADLPSQTLEFLKSEMAGDLRNIIAVDGNESFGNETYQVIVTLDCLEHTVDPIGIMKKLLTALRPGGILMVSFPVETDFTLAHTREAQEQRPAVFRLIEESCETITKELVYRKN